MSKQSLSVLNDDGVLLCGYYKKLKTMKKKFFVLYNETPCKVARIEYYDNEKKYKSGFTPKRIIKIKNCFNINRRLHTKHDFVIVLASKDGGFGLVMESEDEMNTWLNHLLHLQRSGEPLFDFPKFDYVWQVLIQKKGIAEQHNIFGSHHICLTNKSITFIKIGRDKNVGEKKTTKIDVLLTTIRRCGDSQCYFYMEIGRQSSLGPGELWMEAEDNLTAQNMHKMILSKMVSLNDALIEPMRRRSSSATETTNLHHDRKSSQNSDVTCNYLISAQNFSRDRCDSLPSRNRTSSESSNRIIRMMPTTSNNRVNIFHGSNTSPVTYSASEESVSVDDSEECVGKPFLISSRSPESIIPEEHISDASQFQNKNYNADMNSVASSSMRPFSKTNPSTAKLCGATKYSDISKDICSVVYDQFHFSAQTSSLGSKCDIDITKAAVVNRVRAFSVGSRVKSSRICSKTSHKLFNGDSVDCSTRKSISVPVLINKNLQSADQMGDLMEIDFSKSIGRVFNKNIRHIRKECQSASNMPPSTLTVSNSEESIQRSIKKTNNGYLEMKPITLDTDCMTSTGNARSQILYSFERKDQKMKDDTLNERRALSSLKDTNDLNLNDENLYASDKDSKLKSITSTSVYVSVCSKNSSDGIKLSKRDNSDVNKDLYYASLDLPKCDNEINNRYGFEESLSDTNIGDITNEYAKINFTQSDTSQSLSLKKS